ncbi:aminopeptidase A-like [Frankliniella occidentalis]|nr:aminopeptidase A-like [Frankliniella occidentalis]
MSRLGTSRVQSALDADSLEHSPPLTKDDIQTPDQIEDHFGVITYSKGSNIHYMLLNILGTTVYRNGLQNYLSTNKYKSTTPDDFAAALQESADEKPWPLKDSITIKAVIDSWALKPGYPVLTVLRDYESAKPQAVVSQKRFLAHEPSDPAALDSKWVIPISFNSVYDDESEFTNVLQESDDEKTMDLPSSLLPNNYLYINKEQAGFYRVNYDIRNWMNLAKGASRLDAASRATLIDDLYALNRAGLVDTWIVLWHLQSTLGDTSRSGERDMAPWITAAKVINGYNALARGDPELTTYLQTYLSAILRPAFESIGWTSDDDTEADSYQRSVVRDIITQLACGAGLAECRRQALRTFAYQYNDDNDDNTFDPNVLTATLCMGVKTMYPAYATELVDLAVNTEDVTTKASYLRAAGCTKQSDIVQT